MGDNYAGAGATQLANMLAHLGYHDGAARLYGAGARLDPTAAGELGRQLIAQASADHHNKNT